MDNTSILKKPSWIALSGMDYSGKSTQCKMLADEFDAELLIEPSEGPLGTYLRECISNGTIGDMTSSELMSMFLADGVWQYRTTIKPLLDEGISVVVDRSRLCTFAYQGRTEEQRNLIAEVCKNLPKPDLLFYIDIDYSDMSERRAARTGKLDYYDKVDEEGFSKRRDRYLKGVYKHAESFGNVIEEVYGGRDIDIVQSELIELVHERLAK